MPPALLSCESISKAYNARPLFQKITVTGDATHPLYKELIAAHPKATTNEPGAFRQKLIDYGITPNSEPSLLWNFDKFFVSRAFTRYTSKSASSSMS